MYPLARPFLFGLDAETAHGLGLKALDLAYRTGTTPLVARPITPMPTKVMGLTFPNPVGLAAGMDKNGAHIDALFALGFGFVEIGTVTPRPQPGNPKPRMFRLPQYQAVINRLGFNNEGVDALVRNVEAARRDRGLLGINIGKNKDTANERAASDYLYCLERVYPLADYVTVNISSPNTPGLRALQTKAALEELLGRLAQARDSLPAEGRVPMFLKVAPDLEDGEVEAIVETVVANGLHGIIVSNTTITRPSLASKHAGEAGGLSGAPLTQLSTQMLGLFHHAAAGRVALIGAGGIGSGEDAYAKLRAGASAVQLYSAMVYGGPGLVTRIKRDLAACLRRDGFASVAAAVGAN